MGNRKISYVNKKQNDKRVDRALLRVDTLQNHGGGDAAIERAKTSLDRALAADDVLTGTHHHWFEKGADN